MEALTQGLRGEIPQICHTDQGAQFTSQGWIEQLTTRQSRISMDELGRYLDNVFIERLWRTVKHEEVYLKEYQNGHEARAGLSSYFLHYHRERHHQS